MLRPVVYNYITDMLSYEDIETLSIEEQNNILRVEIESLVVERRELLKQVLFLDSQISKYQNINN